MSDKLSLNASERKKQKAKKQSSTRKPLTPQQREDMLLTPCKTKEELHNWIKYHLGIWLPDYTVSRYADTNPLDAVWQIYDICVNKNNPEEVQELLYVASRGAGKTLGVAIAELLVLLHDQRDVAHVGAIMAQAKRCYDYQVGFMLNDKLKPVLNVLKPGEGGDYRILEKMNMEKSMFNLIDRYTGESIRPTLEILPATLKAVNGAHVSLCISGTSNILLANQKKISASGLHRLLQAGSTIEALSYNTVSNKIETKPIIASYNNGKKDVIKLTTKSAELILTPDHKIWVPNRSQYVQAGFLFYRDSLLLCDGSIEQIESIDVIPEQHETFDFTIADNHNFFANGFLIHNCVVDEIDTVQGEGVKAFKDISGMIDSKKGREALRVGISTRKSRYGLMNQQIENAEAQGRTVKKWTAFEFAERCPDSRSGKNPSIGYYNQDDMETILHDKYEKLPQQIQSQFIKHKFPGEKCLTCVASPICLGDAKKQTSKSPMLKPITDVLKKVVENGPDWALSQLMNLKPSVEGIIYKEFEERVHVKDWNQMWELLTGQEYPGSCTHDAFVRKCHQMKIPAYGAVDFGWSNPSTLVVFFVDKKDTVYVVRTEAMTYVNNPSWVQMIKNKWHHMYRCQLYFPDPANPGDLVTFKQEGLPVPSKIDKDVNSGIQVVKKFLKSLASPHPKLYVSKENNEYLIKEFQTYHYKLDAAGEITDTPDKEYDHALDALRYGLYNLFGKSTFIMSELGVQYNDNIQTMDGSFTRMPSVEEFATSKGIDLKIKNPSEIPSLGQMGTAAELDELDEEDGSGGGFIWQF